MSYWDTSALVKLYVQEPDSARFQAMTGADIRLFTARLSRYEAWTMFRRREAAGLLPPEEALALLREISTDIAAGNIVIQEDGMAVEREFSAVMEACLSQTPPVFIRTNDALHLASAKVAGETEFVIADGRQRAAALLVGFTVLP
ncbi:MAG: type II toxin-antitoxin system VapC family toxin [Chthoniobacter sp.]|nr:type II toxin-antitoxin system VapC family toxin [Chthoniobacter sp.]